MWNVYIVINLPEILRITTILCRNENICLLQTFMEYLLCFRSSVKFYEYNAK